jgi:hypothetical protein
MSDLMSFADSAPHPLGSKLCQIAGSTLATSGMFGIYRGEVLRAFVVLCEGRHVERQLRITRGLFKLNGNAMDMTPLEGILMRADDSLRSAMASAGNNT